MSESALEWRRAGERGSALALGLLGWLGLLELRLGWLGLGEGGREVWEAEALRGNDTASSGPRVSHASRQM